MGKNKQWFKSPASQVLKFTNCLRCGTRILILSDTDDYDCNDLFEAKLKYNSMKNGSPLLKAELCVNCFDYRVGLCEMYDNKLISKDTFANAIILPVPKKYSIGGLRWFPMIGKFKLPDKPEQWQ